MTVSERIRYVLFGSALALILFSALCSGAPSGASDPSIKLVLTSRLDRVVPETEFACAGQILAYATFSEGIPTPHHVEAHWLRPDGHAQEKTRIQLSFSDTGGRTAYFWIKFDEDSSLDGVRHSGGTAGEKTAFDGTWSFQLHSDDALLAESSFDMTCQTGL